MLCDKYIYYAYFVYIAKFLLNQFVLLRTLSASLLEFYIVSADTDTSIDESFGNLILYIPY